MASGKDMFRYEYREKDDVLVGVISAPNMDKDEAFQIFAYAESEMPQQPKHSHFILDARTVKSVSDPAIGILMKSLSVLQKVKGYMILVMTESLLQDVMLRHPAMFDYYAVFHSIEDAVTFAKK